MTKADDRFSFGGGCHWCTEAVFQHVGGVTDVRQGFIRSVAPNESWSEAVWVTFDPGACNLATLIDVHIRTHSAFSDHSMRGKYRSAVYARGVDAMDDARSALAAVQATLAEPLVTRVLAFEDFKPSDERFHDYHASGPDRPFCRTYIVPKLRAAGLKD